MVPRWKFAGTFNASEGNRFGYGPIVFEKFCTPAARLHDVYSSSSRAAKKTAHLPVYEIKIFTFCGDVDIDQLRVKRHACRMCGWV